MGIIKSKVSSWEALGRVLERGDFQIDGVKYLNDKLVEVSLICKKEKEE